MFFEAKSYFNYLLNGKTRYYIHSPFVFGFINKILLDKREFYFYDDIKKLRVGLLTNSSLITIEDFGAGSKKNHAIQRQISTVAKTSSIPEKYGRLLSCIVNHFQCKTILELGTSLGLSTSYLSFANSKATVITLEGSNAIAKIAAKNFELLHLKNIELIIGNFSENLNSALTKLGTVDLAFIDGNHSYEPTINYFNQLLSHVTNNSILIFDDIHWSPEMEKAWNTICSHPQVTVTIDLFRMGIVFFRKEQAKENFILYF